MSWKHIYVNPHNTLSNIYTIFIFPKAKLALVALIHILWSMKTVFPRLTFAVSKWDNYFGMTFHKTCFTVPDEHKTQLASYDMFEQVVLPKNRSRIRIGNTWNDNGLFQSDGYVLDFIVHYWWNGFFHFCKIMAINFNRMRSHLSLSFFNFKFTTNQSIEFVLRYCSRRHPVSVSEVFDSEKSSVHHVE